MIMIFSDLNLLIDEVEKRPLLWDLSNVKYSNKNHKEMAWKLVGDACGCSGWYFAQYKEKHWTYVTTYDMTSM